MLGKNERVTSAGQQLPSRNASLLYKRACFLPLSEERPPVFSRDRSRDCGSGGAAPSGWGAKGTATKSRRNELL